MDNIDNSTWRKASYSGNSGNCVEVAYAPRVVLVRDTTNRDGVTLAVPADVWQAFTTKLK